MNTKDIHRTLIAAGLTAIMSVTGLAQEGTSSMTGTVSAEPVGTTSISSTAPATPAVVTEDGTPVRYNAEKVKDEFLNTLYRHPHEVAAVLRYDPSLFRNEQYMQNYPELAAFVKAHPEVAQNPSFFLRADWIPQPGGRLVSAEERAASNFLESITIMLVFSGVTLALIWLIRTLLNHRRWTRAWKVQMDLHNKLLDRLTTHEDLLRYVENGAGRQLLEAANAPSSPQPESVAPLNRILWSVQAGIVVVLVGLGLQLISLRGPAGTMDEIFGLGIIALSAGVGLILSSIVSYNLSRRLGLTTGTAPAVEQR